VKALLDEEFLGRFLDPAFVFFDSAGTEFWHSAYKNERPYFYLSAGRCQVNPCNLWLELKNENDPKGGRSARYRLRGFDS
jgi:hypothetical protein